MVGFKFTRGAAFRCKPERQTGMVLSEYLIGTTVVAIALFAPIPAVGESSFEFLIGALRAYQDHSTYLMSMP